MAARATGWGADDPRGADPRRVCDPVSRSAASRDRAGRRTGGRCSDQRRGRGRDRGWKPGSHRRPGTLDPHAGAHRSHRFPDAHRDDGGRREGHVHRLRAHLGGRAARSGARRPAARRVRRRARRQLLRRHQRERAARRRCGRHEPQRAWWLRGSRAAAAAPPGAAVGRRLRGARARLGLDGGVAAPRARRGRTGSDPRGA